MKFSHSNSFPGNGIMSPRCMANTGIGRICVIQPASVEYIPPPLLESPTTTNDQFSPPYSSISVEKSFQQHNVKRHNMARKEVTLGLRTFLRAPASRFDFTLAFSIPYEYTGPNV